MITKHQANWASQHDWYQGYTKSLGLIKCYELNLVAGVHIIQTVIFSDIKELREWAGY